MSKKFGRRQERECEYCTRIIDNTDQFLAINGDKFNHYNEYEFNDFNNQFEEAEEICCSKCFSTETRTLYEITGAGRGYIEDEEMHWW